jgi:hypothetical protein
MNNRFIFYLTFIMLLLLLVACYTSGDLTTEKAPSERMMVEGQLTIASPVAYNSKLRPIRYGLRLQETYLLRFVAEKYIYATEAEMQMKIILPREIQLVSENPEWKGPDKRKILEIMIKPTASGVYTISGVATNLQTNFETMANVMICVNTDISQLEECVTSSR